MPNNYALGLTFTAPAKGDTDWASVEDAKNTRISQHDHTGGGLGAQIGAAAVAANAIGATHIRLANNTALRGRNAAGSADVELLKLGTDNLLDVLPALKLTSSQIITLSGASSTATLVTLLNSGISQATTLADGSSGQLKIFCNIGTGIWEIDPSSATGPNKVALPRYGTAVYMYLSSEWRLLSVSMGDLYDNVETITSSGAATITVTRRQIIANYSGGATKTLAAGWPGQTVDIVNINANNAVFVGSASAGVNQATLVTNGSVRYVYMSSEWRAFAGAGCTLA